MGNLTGRSTLNIKLEVVATDQFNSKNYDISYIYKIFLNKLEWSRLNLKQITARNERIHI